MARARRTGGGSRARRARPADAVRPDRRPVRCVVRRPPGRGTGLARAERGGQDHDDRNTRGLPDAVVRAGQRARHRSGARRGGVAGPDRGGPAVLAGPWQMAGPGTARAPRFVLRAVLGSGGLSPRVGVPRPWDVDELIATVGLTEQAGQRVRRLSGGQRRRLDVAIGIVGRPELLFLDEPTAGFDPEARREFHDLVHRLADREEATILLTTHDLDEAEKLADRILILAGRQDHRGRFGGRAVPADVHPGRGAVEPRRAAVRALGGRADPVRPRAVPAVRRVRRGPGGAAGQPGGHLHGAGPAGRIGVPTWAAATRSGSSRWWRG